MNPNEWRKPIDEFVPTCKLTARIKAASIRFLDSEWLPMAQQRGWGELELWGVFRDASVDIVRRRADAMGLVPFLAMGILKCELVTIGDHAAIMTTRDRTSPLTFPRRIDSPSRSAVWWKALAPASALESTR